MKKCGLVFIFLLSFFLFACDNESSNHEGTYGWMNGSMEVGVTNTSSVKLQSKAVIPSTDVQPLANQSEEYTATCITFINSHLGAVSYHGRNGQFQGKIELFTCDDQGAIQVVGVLTTPNRINNLTTDQKDRLFMAVDTKNGPVLSSIRVSQNGFADQTSLSTLRLNGESANGLLYSEEKGIAYIYSATGGNGRSDIETPELVYSFDGKSKLSQDKFLANPGFQKTQLLNDRLIPIAMQGNGNNRGKWVAKEGSGIVTLHYSTYGAFSHATIQYYPNFVNQFFSRQIDQRGVVERMEVLDGKNVCLLAPGDLPDSKILYICAADKGIRSYRLAGQQATAIAQYPVYTTAAVMEGNRLYLASGEKGVYVIETVNGQFNPLKTYRYDKSGASANFIAVNGNHLYIAYGQHGVVVVPKESDQMKPIVD